MKKLTAACLKEEKIYAKGDRNIQFTVFEKENGMRDIYFIATDWHKQNPDGVGKIIMNNIEYDIPVSWGQLVKVSACKDFAIYPENDENEVISLDGTTAKVQGKGLAKFILCKNGEIREMTVDFRNSSVQELKI